MLPSQLLITRKNSGQIRPAYVAADEEHVKLGEKLIAIYNNSIGKKRSQILKEVSSLEYGRFNFRLVRGLATLLERQATFVVDSPVDPYKLRNAVFARSRGFASSGEERSRILESVAREFNIAPGDVERFLWNDLEDEQILNGFAPVRPKDLLASYNLSLTQTLLFKATYMEFKVKQNWKRIFRNIKRLGLMYSIERDDGGYQISLEGPVALLKLTERYGTNLAKLLPEILASGEWILRAQIVSRWQEESRLLSFTLGSSEGVLLPSFPTDLSENYDSLLESSFANRFNSMGSRWKLLREPEPLPAGTTVMIPDFAFVLGQRRIFLEIVGFWTPDYLAKKLSKLQKIVGVDIIVAVDSGLGISKKVPGKVIVFDGEVPLKPILEYLEAAERVSLDSEVKQLSRMQITVDGDFVPLNRLSDSMKMSKEALVMVIKEHPIPGYRLIGESLIKEEKLEGLKRVVSGEHLLSSVALILEPMGIKDPYPLLNYFGYQVKWKGINPESAKIVKEKVKKSTM
ncbi:MAG: DUF790 family protein [Candidatus Methanomethylicaceae archaeon]|jgi:predicted nuclease of restriction endonuclease-like RecB superfamily